MNLPPFEPRWALWVGCLIAPLACTLNAALLEFFVSDSPIKTAESLAIGLVMSFLTVPQGGVTFAILDFWQKGEARAARGLSAFCALVAPLFWLFCWHGLELKMQWPHRGAAPLFGALLLPFLWSVWFVLFVFLSRSRRA